MPLLCLALTSIRHEERRLLHPCLFVDCRIVRDTRKSCSDVISLTSTFHDLEDLRNLILRVKDVETAPFIIVGNKEDLREQRVIPREVLFCIALTLVELRLTPNSKDKASLPSGAAPTLKRAQRRS